MSIEVFGILLRTKIYTACLALVAAIIVAIGHNFSTRYIAAAYIGADAFFSVLAVIFNWKIGFRSVVLYIALTATWLAVAFVLLKTAVN